MSLIKTNIIYELNLIFKPRNKEVTQIWKWLLTFRSTKVIDSLKKTLMEFKGPAKTRF